MTKPPSIPNLIVAHASRGDLMPHHVLAQEAHVGHGISPILRPHPIYRG
jgi:hypothetical protein